jgi:DNA-directed RNA polymerase specialized sigma24 family protein
MLDALGLRGTRRRAHLGAVALDAPICEDGITRGALLPDTSLPDADDRLVSIERRAAVRAAVGRLTSRRREVIMRHDLQGASFAAVGVALGLTPDAAWKLRRKALNELRIDPVLRKEVTIDG